MLNAATTARDLLQHPVWQAEELGRLRAIHEQIARLKAALAAPAA